MATSSPGLTPLVHNTQMRLHLKTRARLHARSSDESDSMTRMTQRWFIDELKHAGHEHLDADFVAGYDRKQGYNISPSARESACGGRRGLFQSRRARKRRIFEPQVFPKYHETYYAAY